MKVTTVERMVWTDPVIAAVPVPEWVRLGTCSTTVGSGRHLLGDQRPGTQPQGCCRHQALWTGRSGALAQRCRGKDHAAAGYRPDNRTVSDCGRRS
jgi:hypothetical protein